MNKFKIAGLAGAIALAAVAGQALATPCPAAPATGIPTSGSPVCLAPYGLDGVGTGLANILSLNTGSNPHGIITSGPNVDVYNSQILSSFWTIGSTGSSTNQIKLELAGNVDINTFGIFDPTNPSNTLLLFSGPASAGATTFLTYNGSGNYLATYLAGNGQSSGNASVHFGDGSVFGYYLGTPFGAFFSDPALNEVGGSTYPTGTPHMVAYIGGHGSDINGAPWLADEYIMAWEDTPFSKSDLDYNDFIVEVESVAPVPEPAVLGLFGLGVLMIGLFAGLRRRNHNG